MTVNDVLLKFLYQFNLNDEELKLVVAFAQRAAKASITAIGLSALRRLYSSEDLIEQMTNEAIECILEKREVLLEKLSDSNIKITDYMFFVIRNYFIDKVRKKTINVIDEEITDYDKPYKHNPTITLEAEELNKIVQEKMSEAEKEALCFELRELMPANKSQAAFEKAKSRAKSRMRSIVKEYGFSVDVVFAFFDIYAQSELCEKIVLNSKSKQRS